MIRLILALLLTGSASAALGATFECRDAYGIIKSAVLVVAQVNEDRESGTIEVAGVTHQTEYRVIGFDRTWAWGGDGDEFPLFVFVIQPDGTGLYFVSPAATPKQRFKCRER